jgi:DNA-binding response OmpR family regulator
LVTPDKADCSDRPSSTHHILVVDDEEVMRRMLTRALGEARHWCASTGSGEEAVELLEQQVFDLAVVDKNLPDLGGIEVARAALGSQPPVPVIIVTGYPSDESRREATSIGVSSYLTKPFGVHDLRQEVSGILDSPEERAAGIDRPVETNVAIMIVEPDAAVRHALLTVLTGTGCRVVAFRSRHQAENHVRHVGYDVLIARPALLRETKYWASRAKGGPPLGSVAVLDDCALDRKVEAIQLGAGGVLTPPFEASGVIAELRAALARMRGR